VRQRETVPASGFACPDFKSRHVPVRPTRTGVLLIVALWPAASLARSSLVRTVSRPNFSRSPKGEALNQIKLLEGTKKADQAEVLRRDLAAFGGLCLDR